VIHLDGVDKRRFTTFVGIDLGGARGKTTAISELRTTPDGVAVHAATTRAPGATPWLDPALWDYLSGLGDGAVVAVNAPLTQPACARCTRPVCPGVEDCVEPAVVWLRTEGERLVAGESASEEAIEEAGAGASRNPGEARHVRTVHPGKRARIRLQPYMHRATEIVLAYQRGLVPTTAVGTAVGPVAARAGQLRKRLAGCGFALNDNLLEVSPAATLSALVGRKRTRATRRDTDAWAARAMVLEGFGDLVFAPTSRFAREDALRSLHVFDALVAAYTAYRWAKDGWTLPAGGVFDDDGWIWTP
jgi:hypothetical protein